MARTERRTPYRKTKTNGLRTVDARRKTRAAQKQEVRRVA